MSKSNIFKIVFIWSAIIAGILGAIFGLELLVVICIVMLGVTAVYIRYTAMREGIIKPSSASVEATEGRQENN